VTLLAALSGVGLAAGGWLLLTSILGEPIRMVQGPARSVPRRRPQIDGRRWAIVAGAAAVTLLVSRWPVAAVAAGAAAWFVPLPGERAARQGAEARTAALALWCSSLRDAAGTARGIEGILTATAPAAPAAIRPEVTRMAARLESQRLDVVLTQLAAELDHHIGDLVVTALRLAASAGSRRVRQVLGDLATAAELEAGMRRRVDVARQRPRTTARLVTVIVAAFVAGLVAFAGDYLAPYDTALGQLVLISVALWWAAGFWWLARLGRLPQPPRILARNGGGVRP
jgi:tight adherence protein B